jgi:hypothetical protein
MGKQKIGRDITEKKGSAIISSPKESEEFEQWKEEQKEERPKEQVEIKSKMPDEGQPTDEELARAKEQEMAEFAKAKLEGKLKVIPEQE